MLFLAQVYIPVWMLMPFAVLIQAVCGILARIGIRVQPLLLPAEIYKVNIGYCPW